DTDAAPARTARWKVQRAAAAIVAAITVPVSIVAFSGGLGLELPGAAIVAPLAAVTSPLRVVNRYGMFAVMTTTRPEIIIEGSDDGRTWLPYEFRYKPGDLKRPPPW